MIKVVVSGAAGRMGQAVCEAVEGAADTDLSGKADPSLGVELAEVLGDAHVVVDFTTPATALANAEACLAAGVEGVIGTAVFDLDARKAVSESPARNCFVAPNFAMGAVLMMEVS